jgi:hypothetical protein
MGAEIKKEKITLEAAVAEKQAASPDKHRGENIAAGNFLSFGGVIFASGLDGGGSSFFVPRTSNPEP